MFFSHGTNHSKGTMILINPKIKCNVQKKICDKNGRYIILDIAVADTRFVLVNIYAPNDVKQQVAFFKELQGHLQEFSEETMIMGVILIAQFRIKTKKVVIQATENTR